MSSLVAVAAGLRSATGVAFEAGTGRCDNGGAGGLRGCWERGFFRRSGDGRRFFGSRGFRRLPGASFGEAVGQEEISDCCDYEGDKGDTNCFHNVKMLVMRVVDVVKIGSVRAEFE